MEKLFEKEDYQRKDEIQKTKKELVLLKDKLHELQQHISPFKIYIQKEVPMLENLLEYYRKSDGAVMKCECEGGSEEKSNESCLVLK